MITRAKRRRLHEEQNADLILLPSPSEVLHEASIKRVKAELGELKVVELRRRILIYISKTFGTFNFDQVALKFHKYLVKSCV